jgi:DNA-binding MarR family transcriptional regulator
MTAEDVAVSPEDVAEAFLAVGRTLMGISIASVAAARVEITMVQYRVLALLADEGRRTVGEIGEELGVNASNATRHCDRLQKLGLLGRRRSTTDARVVRVALTASGRRLVDQVSAHRRSEILRVLERMPVREQVAAVQALAAFDEAAREHGGTAWVAPPEVSPSAGQRARPAR